MQLGDPVPLLLLSRHENTCCQLRLISRPLPPQAKLHIYESYPQGKSNNYVCYWRLRLALARFTEFAGFTRFARVAGFARLVRLAGFAGFAGLSGCGKVGSRVVPPT